MCAGEEAKAWQCGHGAEGDEAECGAEEEEGDERGKERYLGTKPELRDAMQVVDTLMKSATEAENQSIMLEDMLLKNEARYIKDTDDMFGRMAHLQRSPTEAGC